jgi:hypothetical protein
MKDTKSLMPQIFSVQIAGITVQTLKGTIIGVENVAIIKAVMRRER